MHRKKERAGRGDKRAIGGGNVEHRLVRRTGWQHQADVGSKQPPGRAASAHVCSVGHRVIDLATLLDGTKSHERFNAGG
jgi:hypothetical protein